MSDRDVRAKMLVFFFVQGMEGLTEVLTGCLQGYPAQNLLFGLIVFRF